MTGQQPSALSAGRGGGVPKTGRELLDRAASVVARRRREYGEPVEVFEAIARRWSTLFGTPISAAQVVIALLDVKLVRLSRNPKHVDSVVDLAGLCGCVVRGDA